MSTNADIPEIESDESPPPPDPNSLRGKFRDPGVRNYLFAGLGALAMIFLVLFQQGSDVGGILLVVLGATGMIFRWPAVPSFVLLILLYFLIFPFGYWDPYENPDELRRGHFRVADVLLAFSVVVYLAAHYRIYGLTEQILPWEPRGGRRKRKPTRRPAGLIRTGEIARLLYLTAGVVFAGQLLWLLTTNVAIDANADFPFKLAEERPFLSKPRRDELYFWHTRLIVLLGIGFFGTLLARLGFGYWKLRTMTPAEGGMMVQDAGWDQTRRELTRVEKWRIWGKDKEDAKANADD